MSNDSHGRDSPHTKVYNLCFWKSACKWIIMLAYFVTRKVSYSQFEEFISAEILLETNGMQNALVGSIKASCNSETVSYKKKLTYKRVVREEDAKIRSECSGCHKNLEEPSLRTSWHQRLIESPLLQVLVIGFLKTQWLRQRSTRPKDRSPTIILKSDVLPHNKNIFLLFFCYCSCMQSSAYFIQCAVLLPK